MINYFPGFFQMVHKRYVQGIAIFVFTAFSLLLLFRIAFFPTVYQNPKNILILVAVFFAGIIWHLFSIVHIKSTMPLIKETPEALYEKGRLACLKQNFELAEICFRKLLKIKPQDEDAVYQLGKTCLAMKKNNEASELFKKYLSGTGKKWRHEIEDYYEEILKK